MGTFSELDNAVLFLAKVSSYPAFNDDLLMFSLEKILSHPVRLLFISLSLKLSSGFPGGTVVESLPANAGDAGSSPGLGRSHMPRSN